jgi:epoxyqueuosine reductase QueG
MSKYTIRFLSIYQWQADYEAIERETGKAYRIRIEEPEGKAISSHPEAPPEVIAATIEHRNAQQRAGIF